MLNPFPELLAYSFFAPLLLRLVLGLLFIDLGLLKFKGEKQRWIASFDSLRLRPADLMVTVYGALQIAGGLMLIAGLWTQVAALFFVLSTGAELFIEWKTKEILKRDLVFYILTFVMALSLLVTGAGVYAIDIPL